MQGVWKQWEKTFFIMAENVNILKMLFSWQKYVEISPYFIHQNRMYPSKMSTQKI